jgi:hypothetical protein
VHDALREAMARDPRVILLGQDIAEYGGVFKCTEGLAAEFGKSRVRCACGSSGGAACGAGGVGVGERGREGVKVDYTLLHALLDLASPAALDAHPKVGASWEGFVIEELIALAGERNAYCWRTQAGAELDLLLMPGGRRIGVEVKYADAPAMSRSMHVSIDSLKLDRLYVIYPGDEAYTLQSGVEVLPLAMARERVKVLVGAGSTRSRASARRR